MRRQTVTAALAAAVLSIATVGCETLEPAPDAGESPTTGSPPATASPTAEAEAGTPPQDDPPATGLAAVPGIVDEVGPSVVAIRFAQGVASGVVWREDGLIITNAHVIEQGVGSFDVVFADGRARPAEVVGSDPRTDLAVIRVEGSGLPAATFAEELPDVGSLAVALGNPLGFENSATAGIVSGLDRELPSEPGGPTLVGLLQTDAPISPGNSGGPLVGADGRVIGINVAAVGAQVQANSIGFAIPAASAVGIAEELVEEGEVRHAALGIRGAGLTPQVAERFGIDLDSGVVVADVVPDSAAQEAGIRPGDVIVAIDGEPVDSIGDLLLTLREHDPGDVVTVDVHRDGETSSLEVELQELP